MCSLASWSHQKFSQDIERAQKRCKMLLYPALSYNQTLIKSGLERLDFRHDVNVIAQKMFQEIKDTKHPLHYLLPPVKVSNNHMVLRLTYPSKSSRGGRDFIPYSTSKKF